MRGFPTRVEVRIPGRGRPGGISIRPAAMVAAAEMREIPRKGACHGLQETPDGREILREEVLRRRLPDEHCLQFWLQ